MPRIEGLNVVNQNLIYNPEGYLFQRTTPGTPTAINTDNYGPDRWNILCSANAVNISRTTDAPAGSEHAMVLAKATASGFFGICQMLENIESVPLRNKTVTVGLQVKGTLALTQVRISVLGWTGTADTITSSIVSSWASIPTYIGSVTQYATGLFNVTTGYTQIKLSAPIDGACNNLMIFIHTPNSQSVADAIQVSQVQMNVGTYLNGYQRRQSSEEVARCQRYYEKSYDADVIPGTAGNVNGEVQVAGLNATSVRFSVAFKTRKRAAPNYVAYSPVTGASGQIRDVTAGADRAQIADTYGEAGARTSWAGTANNEHQWHWTADAEL